MKLMAFTNAEGTDAAPVSALYFDGYRIAERLLEGLPIKVEVENGEFKISADWPAGADVQHYTAGALKFLRFAGNLGEEFSTTPELDNDDGFISED